MNHRRFLSSLFPLPIMLVLQVMLGIPQSLGNPFEECRDAQFKCGQLSAKYPFSGPGIPLGCGHPNLTLVCDESDTTTIEIDDVTYQVMEIHPDSQTLTMARQDLIKTHLCHPDFKNPNVDFEFFDLVNPSDYANVTLLYNCSIQIPNVLGHFNCSGNGAVDKNFWVVQEVTDPLQCSYRVTVPILRWEEPILNFSLLRQGIEKGFEVKWKLDNQACQKCNENGGVCGFKFANQTTCYCRNANLEERTECPRQSTYVKGSHSNSTGTTLIELTVGVSTAILVVCAIFFIVWRLRGEPSSITRSRKNNASVEEFITKFSSLASKRYFYKDIKKMTNKFKDKLGQGGYGSVYKGNLPDGRFVAVKVLSESKGNGEDFMNEVASISRTSHVNIVTLLGFCYDRSKRALVYEFMPHGSLDKFIYNQGSQDQSRQLEWKTLYDIALGIARGLEYLHQGCNTRILHFDIKPHNILLDENFCPKISDFGLSKLCERKESIISMTGARGTAGYIAPEVFCRSFGGVSHKSDVYSYGMMVLEMVGGRKNINVEVSRTSEIYFPSWIYGHIDEAMNLSLDGVTAEEEEDIIRRLTVASLWCIQTNPRDRPSMTKVLEMLQGHQSLEIPPRPFVSSPVRSPTAASTT